MIKRALSIIISLSLVIALSSGCASNRGKTTDNNVNTSTQGNAPKEIPKIYLFQNSGVPQGAAVPASKQEDYDKIRQIIIDNVGVEVVPIVPPKDTVNEKLNMMLASNEQIDLFRGDWVTYQTNGVLQPLNSYLDTVGQDIKKLWPDQWKDSWKAVTDKDGKIWGIPEVPALAPYNIFIRTDWLNKLGLKMPKTVDELEIILKEFKDKNPSGAGETIPFLTTDLTSLRMSLAGAFIDTYGVGNWMDTDGKLKPVELNPGYKDFISKMAEWYKKGYIYKETFLTNRDRYNELVKQNKVGTTGIWYTFVLNNIHPLKQNVPDADYAAAVGIKGSKGIAQTHGDVTRYSWLLTKKAKNPEAAIKYINWIQKDIENYFTVMHGIKGKNWVYSDEKNKVLKKINTDYIGEFMAGNSFAMTVKFSMDDPASKPAFDYIQKNLTALESVKKPFDFGLSAFYNGKEINDKVPTMGDISRLMTEETLKFIVGARPMSDYDKFLQELNKAGMDKYIDAYTEQYKKVK